MERPRAAASVLGIVVSLVVMLVLVVVSANSYLGSTDASTRSAQRLLDQNTPPTTEPTSPPALALRLAAEVLSQPSATFAAAGYPRPTPVGEASARAVGEDVEVSVAGSSACARLSLGVVTPGTC